jgi:hypothetical protein
VTGLVYIAAFALDAGESLGALLSQGPTPPALEHLFTDKQGFGWLPEDDWFLVATQDQAIPPDAERMFASRMGATTIEVPSSHVAMVSHPGEVADLITAAAENRAA